MNIVLGLAVGIGVLIAINLLGYTLGSFLPEKLRNSRYRILIPLLIISVLGQIIYFIFGR